MRARNFSCALALALPGGRVEVTEGTVEGEIAEAERGEGGFGYDPVFLVPGPGRTMAEHTAAEKNRLSHRARAVEAIRPLVEKLCL